MKEKDELESVKVDIVTNFIKGVVVRFLVLKFILMMMPLKKIQSMKLDKMRTTSKKEFIKISDIETEKKSLIGPKSNPYRKKNPYK